MPRHLTVRAVVRRISSIMDGSGISRFWSPPSCFADCRGIMSVCSLSGVIDPNGTEAGIAAMGVTIGVCLLIPFVITLLVWLQGRK